MSAIVYDIAIIGAGAAGLHLALAMREEPFFSDKKILILEKDAKDSNDRTWCFWEKGAGKWDQILRHSWAEGTFHALGDSLALDLKPYRYKMLRGLDFYEYAKKTLASTPQFRWQQDEVLKVSTGDPLTINGAKAEYHAEFVFDSRIPEAFFQPDKYTRILQHFKGWVIRTPEDCFDPGKFDMMDFRLRWKDTTSFTYVLPLNTREALVEFTLFTQELLVADDYDLMLRRYIKDILAIDSFEIQETEQGIIPMSDFPFWKFSTDRHIRIGTGGGWVKASSGYSFKNCERNSRRIVENLKAGKHADHGISSPRFRFYDSVFLGVLNHRNELGPGIFHNMYFKNPVGRIFAFLDEETSLGQEIRIINGFPKAPFLRSLLRYLLR